MVLKCKIKYFFLILRFISYNFDKYVSQDTGCINYSTVSNNTIPITHSNAFLDLNGDCRADLFLISNDSDGNIHLETWIRQTSPTLFCLVDSTILNSGITTFAYEDISF